MQSLSAFGLLLDVLVLCATLGISMLGHCWRAQLVFGTFQAADWHHIVRKRGVVCVGFWMVMCEKWGVCWAQETYPDKSGVL